MWVIITLLVAVYLVWRFSRSENKKIETNKKSVSRSCHYFGGFNDISVKANYSLFLTFEEENLEFMFNKNGDIFYKVIKYSDIKKVRFMNEINISKEISLGKMICFGWLSLAMKKEKKNIKEYVVIDVEYNNDNISIILEDEYNNESLFNEIRSRLNNIEETNIGIKSV